MNQDRYKFDVIDNTVTRMYEWKDDNWSMDPIEANESISFDPSTLKITLIETQNGLQEIKVFTAIDDYYVLESEAYSDSSAPSNPYNFNDENNYAVLYSAGSDDSLKISDDSSTPIVVTTQTQDSDHQTVVTALSNNDEHNHEHEHDPDDLDDDGSEDDHIHGSDDDDSLSGKDGDDVMEGGHGKDRLNGGHGHDDLSGDVGDDKLFGDDGNDDLSGGAGDDFLEGGKGDDTVHYSGAVGGILVDLNKGRAHSRGTDDSAGIGEDKLRNLENVSGGDHDDLLIGNRASNRLDGGLGDDELVGGLGYDYLKGGQGNDVFKFNKLAEIGLQKHDVIEDFSVGDKIDLSAIDTKRGGSIDDSFVWLTDKTALNTANANGAVWFDAGVLYGSTDKDIAPEFEIELSGVLVLNESDLKL